MPRHGRSVRKLKEELFLSPDEARRLLKTAKAMGPEWYVPMVTLRYTGLRENEMVHIQVRDFRFEQALLFVWSGKDKVGAKPVGCECGGYRGNVAVRESMPLHPALAEIVRGWIDYRDLSTGDWLLYSRKNRRRHLTPSRIRQIFDEASEKAGVMKIPQRGPHSFRHLFASEVADITGNPYMVQRAMRHRDVGSAAAYVHVRGLEKVIGKIGQ